MSRNGFGIFQNDFGVSQNGFGAFQNHFGVSQNSFGISPNGFGMSENSFRAYENAFGIAKNLQKHLKMRRQRLSASPAKWKYRAIYRVDDQRVGQWSPEAECSLSCTNRV